MKSVTSVALFSCLVAGSQAFAPQPQRVSTVSKTTSSLNAFATLRADHGEDDALYLMLKAKECAFSDTCSIDDAEYYMKEVVHIESGCAAGTLSGSEVCDVTMAAEIVANLRHKIENGGVSVSNRLSSSLPAATDPVMQLATMSVVAMALTLVMSTTMAADSFTLQEWYWAAKGGFLPDMFVQYFKYGGLSPVEYTTSEFVPFTLQEWYWAIRDGYVPQMVSHFVSNGGM